MKLKSATYNSVKKIIKKINIQNLVHLYMYKEIENNYVTKTFEHEQFFLTVDM